jgi:TolB-like protein
MKPSDRIIYALAAIFIAGAFLMSGCNTPPSDAATDKASGQSALNNFDNSKVFKTLKDAIEENEIKSISIVRIDDMIDNDSTRERQVYQVILEELTKVEELKIIEADTMDIDSFFTQKGIDPSRGLNAQSSIDLAEFLEVDAIMYGSIESNGIDVNLKVYSEKDGGILFVETLNNLKLPMMVIMDNKSPEFEIPEGLLEDIPE